MRFCGNDLRGAHFNKSHHGGLAELKENAF